VDECITTTSVDVEAVRTVYNAV